ncbi:MAG: hypothetical protein V3U43_05430 [Pseudomonadales bacterium]
MTREPAQRLQDQAMDDLRFIRSAMANASQFTAVPGRGIIGVGITAIAAAFVANSLNTDLARLATWVIEAALAFTIGGVFLVQKARRASVDVTAGPGRKFMLAALPSFGAALLISIAAYRLGDTTLVPAVWILLYGTAVIAAGAFSVRPVPIMGCAFLVAGALTLFLPIEFHNLMLGASFGALHIVFGYVIARHHGG